MKNFTPIEYICIDIANAYGLDKELFEDRIQWVKDNAKNLESLAQEADDYPIYMKAVIALRKAIKTGRSNHMVELDAINSGMQILSCLSGCVSGAGYTGLVHENVRSDAYTSLMHIMNEYLPEDKRIGFKPEGLSRQDLKDALMTFFYYSTAQPEKVFGAASVELATFYKSTEEMAPGACMAMTDLGNAITEGRTRYSWNLPDGFTVVTKVMKQIATRITIDEIPTQSGKSSTYTHVYDVEGPDAMYKALPANVTHSVDAYVVREMARRCNHNKEHLMKVYSAIQHCKVTDTRAIMSLRTVTELIEGTKQLTDFTENQLGRLAQIIEGVIDNPSFPITTVHDAFKTYPQYCNEMRYYYKEILAEIAESNLMETILNTIYGVNGTYTKMKGHEELPALIRASNYGLC